MNFPTTVNWWREVRVRLKHAAGSIPSGLEQRTMLNLLADPEALELVLEPYSDLEPRLAVYRAMRNLFIG
jgi:hypothetical protein